MINQELVDFLKGHGVCDVCQLRYLKARGDEYKDLKESFGKVRMPDKLATNLLFNILYYK